MNPNRSNETFVALALAVADTLECPECPEGLRDALNDSVVNELIDLFSADNINMLRALAGLAKSGDGSRKPNHSLWPNLTQKKWPIRTDLSFAPC